MAVVDLSWRAMASEVRLLANDPDDGATSAVRALIDRLERHWSRFRSDSDVSRLNTACGRPVVVHPDTIALVSAMVAGWRTTGGLFDPSVLPALVRSGYDRSVERPDVGTPLPDGPLTIGGVGDIEIDATASTVRVPRGTVLDPGGIGKGLAADLAVAALLATDARGALVGIGGDLSMAGEPADRAGWPVIIE